MVFPISLLELLQKHQFVTQSASNRLFSVLTLARFCRRLEKDPDGSNRTPASNDPQLELSKRANDNCVRVGLRVVENVNILL